MWVALNGAPTVARLRFPPSGGFRLLDVAQKKRAEELRANAAAGGAIAAVRRLARLRQADIPGLSERQVRRIEGGEGTTLSALKRLAAAHGADLNTYIERVAEAARS